MTKEEKENIKNRLSNIGEKVGELALDFISNLEKETKLVNDKKLSKFQHFSINTSQIL